MCRLVVSIFFILMGNFYTNCAGATHFYHVELIVFAHAEPFAIQQEQWAPLRPENFNFKNIPYLNENSESSNILPTSQYILNREEELLTQTQRYRILLHTAWCQTFDNSKPQQWRLQGGRSFTINNISQWEMDGTISLKIKKYFEIETNLLFTAPLSELTQYVKNSDNFNKDDLIYFNFKQMCRMRSNELNYMDYPLYGLVIKIVPDDHSCSGATI